LKLKFVSTLIHIVVGIRSRPQTLRGTKLVNVHEEMPKKVNKFFIGRPLDLGGGGSCPRRPLRPLRLLVYFELLMVNPDRSPLPPNRPYCRPFNYPEYVKDFDPNVHVKVFKVVIRKNGEIEDVDYMWKLVTTLMEEPFMKWGLNFIYPIKPM
jgi:hypothetical protein